MSRPAHRHHQGHGPPYAGLHTGRSRTPRAGKLVIHRPGEPDEVVTATEFRRRAAGPDEADADSALGVETEPGAEAAEGAA